MIPYQEMLDKHTVKELTEKEIEALQMMEQFTDEAIEKQFGHGYSIHVDANAIDKLASGFGLYRRTVLLDAWKEMYDKGGWKVEYSSGQMDNNWVLSSKKR